MAASRLITNAAIGNLRLQLADRRKAGTQPADLLLHRHVVAGLTMPRCFDPADADAQAGAHKCVGGVLELGLLP